MLAKVAEPWGSPEAPAVCKKCMTNELHGERNFVTDTVQLPANQFLQCARSPPAIFPVLHSGAVPKTWSPCVISSKTKQMLFADKFDVYNCCSAGPLLM